MQGSNAIEIRDLTVAYEGDPVLWKINADLKKERVTAIVGPNGAGKSTLLNTMLDFHKPVAGEVTFYFDGAQGSYADHKNKVAYVPQKTSVDWDFPTDVLDVVLMGRYGHLRIGQRPGKEDREIAMEMLDKVGMASFAKRQISQLSGGQRQRVFLARALAEKGEIMILDEPLAGVDIKTEKILMDLLKEEAERGHSVIVVHHDLTTVEEYFDDVLFLNREVIVHGPVSEVFTEEYINETYRQDHNIGNLVKGNG